MLLATRGRTVLHWDGRNFTSRGRRKFFGTMAGAFTKGEELLRRHPVLRGYKLYVRRV